MVPSRIPDRRTRRRAAAALAGALIILACRPSAREAPLDPADPEQAAELVRRQYRSGDVIAAGAWVWQAGPGRTFVLVDAQSGLEGLVQARADLWLVADSAAERVGRSDVMPSAAEIGAWRFEDLTGDGVPDLLGWVADSAGVGYPVFLTGAAGAMREEIAIAAPSWRFATDEDPATVPDVMLGSAGACALKLWADEPLPDGSPIGWRYLTILRDGRLEAPRAAPPACP